MLETFIDEDARLAVKKGINWFDENHPGWETRIDLTQLDMSECKDCVIGQAVGDYSAVTRHAGVTVDWREATVWAVEHGFESPHATSFTAGVPGPVTYSYRELDTLWSEEVRSRKEEI